MRKNSLKFREVKEKVKERETIEDLAKNVLGRTFCPLGDAAAVDADSEIDVSAAPAAIGPTRGSW